VTRVIEALDPDLRGPVGAMLAEPLDLSDIPAARAAAKGPMVMGEAAMSALARVESGETTLPGPAGSSAVRVRITRPKGPHGPLPALLWMHGGGYVFGSMDDDRPLCALMAIEGHCAVVAVEYRLAPEDPFPAALEDCYAALRWMASGADESGMYGARLAIGGASAGGGLAAGLALMARDREEIDVAFQLLVYPMLDDRTAAPSGEAHSDPVVWSRANNLAAWRAYLGCDPGGAA
jgi:acetyl esterase/lipase